MAEADADAHTMANNLLKYPIGIQDFAKLREYGFEYVDKTGYISRLIDKPAYYFLSRPRRFGKSLFLSTLKAFFEGRRDLFNGLMIGNDNVDWEPRAVLHFALNTIDPKSDNAIYETFGVALDGYEALYGKTDGISGLSARLQLLIKNAALATGRNVVVLIDEYDAPLLATINKPSLNASYRETLKSLYSVLKTMDAHIHFAFITGVSRFSQTSLFSGANHLKDISLDEEYAGLCGITEEELREQLLPGVRQFARAEGISEEETLALLKENYDGYHFSKRSPDIYNPFSLLNALDRKEIYDYWFQSGTPSYLIEVLKQEDFFLPHLDHIDSLESGLSVKESYLNNPVALLFETAA